MVEHPGADGAPALPPGELELAELPEPTPGPGEVLVDVVAAGVNRADLAQAAGVTPAQLRVLQIVGEKKDPTAKTLANQMGVSQATVTALVDKLVARSLVSRQPSARSPSP